MNLLDVPGEIICRKIVKCICQTMTTLLQIASDAYTFYKKIKKYMYSFYK